VDNPITSDIAIAGMQSRAAPGWNFDQSKNRVSLVSFDHIRNHREQLEMPATE
jgi:hypothetical protein